MLSKRYYINIVVRILLIVFTCLSLIPFILREERLFTTTSIIILLLLQILGLLHYINRFNREVANFFAALKTNDASFAFHDKRFPDVTEKIRNDITHVRNQIFNITKQKEIQQSYFKSVIENAQTGIIVFNKNGKIDVINKSALELIGIKNLEKIKDLEKMHIDLFKTLKTINPGDDKSILLKGKTKAIPIAIRATEFKQKHEVYKLISFQNIQSELDEKEIDAWHKLIRVLTHEINNTISPIASLANSLEKLYVDETNIVIKKENLNDQIIGKTSEGLHIISQRGEGLIDFVNKYKSIASLKQMDFAQFKVAELFYNLELLMKSKLDEKNINLEIEIIPFDMELVADKKYLEQIFINLLKNSIEAIEHKKGIIKLNAFRNENEKIILKIIDNGKGISEDLIDQIFIPFFTTKELGSGIGLSLARQIMHLHGGSISIQSKPNIETIFTLKF